MAAHRIGYARVSTRDQNLDLQMAAFRGAGCDRVFEDTMSGTKAGRPGLAGGLNRRGIGFVSLTDSIDTTTASGRFFFNVMASLAQMERELMVERTQAGLQAAREQGRLGGRKRIMTEAKIRSARQLPSQGTTSTVLCTRPVLFTAAARCRRPSGRSAGTLGAPGRRSGASSGTQPRLWDGGRPRLGRRVDRCRSDGYAPVRPAPIVTGISPGSVLPFP